MLATILHPIVDAAHCLMRKCMYRSGACGGGQGGHGSRWHAWGAAFAQNGVKNEVFWSAKGARKLSGNLFGGILGAANAKNGTRNNMSWSAEGAKKSAEFVEAALWSPQANGHRCPLIAAYVPPPPSGQWLLFTMHIANGGSRGPVLWRRPTH